MKQKEKMLNRSNLKRSILLLLAGIFLLTISAYAYFSNLFKTDQSKQKPIENKNAQSKEKTILCKEHPNRQVVKAEEDDTCLYVGCSGLY